MMSLVDKTTEIERKHSSQQLLHIYTHHILLISLVFLIYDREGSTGWVFLIKRCRSVIKNMSKRQRAIKYACSLSTSNTRIAFCSIWEATPFETNTLP